MMSSLFCFHGDFLVEILCLLFMSLFPFRLIIDSDLRNFKITSVKVRFRLVKVLELYDPVKERCGGGFLTVMNKCVCSLRLDSSELLALQNTHKTQSNEITERDFIITIYIQ